MFSQTVEYALRAVVHLASDSKPRTTDDIAAATCVPRAYLSKVLQSLVKGKIVRSQRGIGGGVSLAVPAEELTVLAVVNAVEPLVRIRTCPLGLSAHGVNLCPLHRKLDDALAHVEEALGGSTIAEILSTPTKSKPLCPFPMPPGNSKSPK